MNAKYIVLCAAFLMALGGLYIIGESSSSDAAEHPQTFMYNSHATIRVDGELVTAPNSAWPYNDAESMTVVAVLDTGYTFASWYGYNATEGEPFYIYSTDPQITINGNTVTLATAAYGDTTWTLNLNSPAPPTYYTVTINVSPSGYGTVSHSSISVAEGSTIAAGTGYSDSIYVGSTQVTATPHATAEGFVYTFNSWSRSGTTTVNSNTTITAYFDRTAITYTVSIVSSNPNYGTVSNASVLAPYGATITSSGSTVTINGTPVTATPHVQTTFYNYNFTGWTNGSGTVTGNMTVTANFNQVAKDFPVTVFYNSHATIYVDTISQTVTAPNSSWPYPYQSQISIVAVMDEGYSFDHWHGYNETEDEPWDEGVNSQYISINGQTVTLTAYVYGTETFTLYLNGADIPEYTVSFVASPPSYGTFNVNSLSVPEGTTWAINGNDLYISGNVITPIPEQSTLEYRYTFIGWSAATHGTINENMTFTGYFQRSPVITGDGTLWCNDNYNGRVDILFKFESSNNYHHTMDIPLYTGAVAGDRTIWTQTNYSLSIEASYPTTMVTVTLDDGITQTVKTLKPGKWSTFILSINPGDGLITMTPVRTFGSFTDYTLYENQTKTVMDFSNTLNNAAIYTITHNDVGSASNHVRFSVVSTSVFLDTYGIVLYNPTINLVDYFPQYDNIRVNFYSFALYGDSITINHQTYAVVDGKITIQYVSDHGDNFLPGVMPNATVKTRTFELTNIYITYDGGHCFLTFVNDRFTIDLGAYVEGDESISMTGLWYFATMVYSPYTAMEKQLSDWKFMPETTSAQMVLIFIGILFIAGAAVAIHARKKGLGIIDLIIIGGALLVGLLMLGM